MSDVKCPKCKYKYAMSDLYYRTGEEYIFCDRCGYSLSWTIKEEDRKNKKLLKDCEFDKKESGGFGSYSVMFDGGGSTGSFDNKKDFETWKKDIKKRLEEGTLVNMVGDKATEVEYTFKKDGKWFVKDLIKNKEYSFIKKEVLNSL